MCTYYMQGDPTSKYLIEHSITKSDPNRNQKWS